MVLASDQARKYLQTTGHVSGPLRGDKPLRMYA